MPLFGKKEEPVDWLTPVWNFIQSDPGLRSYLQSCIDAEKRRNPNDDWSWQNDPQQQIISLVTTYLLFDAYVKDMTLERLPSEKVRKEYLQLVDDINHRRRPSDDLGNFTKQYVGNLNNFSGQLQRDFRNGKAEAMNYDLNPATGKVFRKNK